MNPIQLLLAVWHLVARVVRNLFASLAPTATGQSISLTPRERRERRERNAVRREQRALRRRCLHGRQTRLGPRARRRRTAPSPQCHIASNRVMARRRCNGARRRPGYPSRPFFDEAAVARVRRSLTGPVPKWDGRRLTRAHPELASAVGAPREVTLDRSSGGRLGGPRSRPEQAGPPPGVDGSARRDLPGERT